MPETDSQFFPSAGLLAMEQRANQLFYSYCQLYYDNATTSVYFMDPAEGAPPGFSGVYLIKKEIDNEFNVTYSCWDGTHVVICSLNGNKATYRVFSTVQLTVDTKVVIDKEGGDKEDLG